VWVLPADFVSTTLAFLCQDFLRILPPYSLTSAPVIFGTIGGIALIIGTAGFVFLKAKSDPDPEASGAVGMDYVFLITLGLTAFTDMLTPYFSLNSRYGNNPCSTFSFIVALFADPL
jgi:citrate/tricarballylate utilization protein